MPGAGELIWYDDIRGFLSDDRLLKFVPEPSMSPDEQLNAAMRFALYLAAILMIARRSLTPVFIVVVVGALTWGMHDAQKRDQEKRKGMLEALDMVETRHAGVCTRPTLDNPFMNVLSSDPVKRPTRPRACDTTRSDIKKKMESLFAHNLYRDSDDPFDRNTSSRQFYTMPVTTIPGDQTAFATWLYGTGTTCKEGNGGRCAALLHRPNLR
jgi:Family of unknown function (DUF5762)